jgi:hypothetical protein
VAALVRLRVSRADAAVMLALFTSQFLLPTVFMRLVLGVIHLVLVVDILMADRRQLRSLARCAAGGLNSTASTVCASRSAVPRLGRAQG